MSFDFKFKAELSYFLIPLCFFISFHPVISSSTALFMGVVLTLFFGNPYLDKIRKVIKPLLAWSIVGLGAGINLFVVLKAGLDGIAFTFVSLSLTLLAGLWIGRLFNTSREMSALINVGTAICGGSAIIALSSVIRPKDESISIALGAVFILNAVALFVFPPLGHLFGLSESQFGLWAALAIHDTSSVVGATIQYGPQALEVGTTVKLVRTLWIIPVTLLFAKFFTPEQLNADNSKVKARPPWFIVGFVAISALTTYYVALQPIGHQIELFARRTLVAILFLIGSGLTYSTLQAAGAKTFLHALILWLVVGSSSLLWILITNWSA